MPLKSITTPKLGSTKAAPRVPSVWFIVWKVAGARPRRRHPTLAGAFAERSRLMRLHPGATFHVFELRRIDGGTR